MARQMSGEKPVVIGATGEEVKGVLEEHLPLVPVDVLSRLTPRASDAWSAASSSEKDRLARNLALIIDLGAEFPTASPQRYIDDSHYERAAGYLERELGSG